MVTFFFRIYVPTTILPLKQGQETNKPICQ